MYSSYVPPEVYKLYVRIALLYNQAHRNYHMNIDDQISFRYNSFAILLGA